MSKLTLPPSKRTWVIFGDDWGAHPSTTQHLCRALVETDRVIWVDSMAMRSIEATPTEALHVWRRLRARRTAHRDHGRFSSIAPHARVSPSVMPLHRLRLVRAMNRAMLRHQLGAALEQLGAVRPLVVTATPVAAYYLDVVDPAAVAYLRLDNYALLPGVDAELIAEVEPEMIARADVVAATARPLLPAAARRTLYLPQGVDAAHFGQAPLMPPRAKVLGFFGLIAEWVDTTLIVETARARPDWTIELIGPTRMDLAWRHRCPNIVWRGPVPYDALPQAIAGWDAAWIPFRVDALTSAVNPVKLREYLAAGLPTFSTPLPEAMALAPFVDIGCDPRDVSQFLDRVTRDDAVASRVVRRASVASHTWAARAAQLATALVAC